MVRGACRWGVATWVRGPYGTTHKGVFMPNCPVSGVAMAQHTLHGVRVDVSDHGVWLDKGELFLITEGKRHQDPGWMLKDLFRRTVKPAVDEGRTLKCPVCDKDMEIEKHHDVHIDWCREHGVWLDDGELEAIQNNLRLDPLFVGKIATRLWETRF